MKLKQKFFIIIFAITVIFSFQKSVNASNEQPYTNLEGVKTSNMSNQNYLSASSRVMSYLITNSDGTISRVENIETNDEKYILVETYNSEYKLIDTVKLERELTLFGGFYSGSTYNFFVFGQKNAEEDDSVTVYRIVKYSKDWQRLGEANITNCNTIVPFSSGTCRMTEDNGTLYIETCHKMYTTSDGLNHQANLGIEMTISSMEVTYCRSEIMNISIGYVSHSFNQFIKAENGYSYTVNHGDGHLRGVNLVKRATGEKDANSYANVLPFNGDYGLNYTGASIGGFELSTNNCIIVGNSIDQDAEEWNVDPKRNIYLIVCGKDEIGTGNQKVIWLTNYDSTYKPTLSTPQLVKINDNKFLIMWEEIDSASSGTIKMVLIDGGGNLLSDVISMGGRLSDCQPIVYNNNVVWYVTINNENGVIFSIDASTSENLEKYNGQNIYSLSSLLSNFDYYYDTSTGEISISNFDNKVSTVDLSECNNLPLWAKVKRVNAETFYESEKITKVILPDSITRIGSHAFGYCSNLEEIHLSTELKEIGEYAFVGCKNLSVINMPENWETIAEGAFFNCSKISGKVTLGESVKSVGTYAFLGCNSLEQVIIENDNLELSSNFFTQDRTILVGNTCKPLEGVEFDSVKSENSTYITVNGEGVVKGIQYSNYSLAISYYIGEIRIANIRFKVNMPGDFNYDITDAGTITLKEYIGTDATVNVPTQINGKTVTNVYGSTFRNNSIIKIVNLPNTITEIGYSPFEYSPNLEAINVDSNNSYFYSIDGVIYDNTNTLITYPEGKKDTVYKTPTKVTTLTENSIVNNKYLKEIYLLSNVSGVYPYSIWGCDNLEKIYIYNNNIYCSFYKSDDYVRYCIKPTDKLKIYGYTGSNAQVYAKNAEISFVSLSTNISKCTISSISNQTYTSSALKPSVTVKYNGKTLKNGTDYTLSYSSNTNTGKATVKITGKGTYTGTVTKYFYIVPKKVSGVKQKSQSTNSITITWSKTAGTSGYEVYKYNSSTKKYEKVKTTTSNSYKLGSLKAGTTYKIKVRAYKTISGKNYYGPYSAETSVSTCTSTPKISKITTGSKKANLTWKKVSGASGYEVYMATSKNGKYSKIKTVSSGNTVKYTKTKLTKNRTYYFKVRTYRTVNGNKIYSSYSSIKSIKIK